MITSKKFGAMIVGTMLASSAYAQAEMTTKAAEPDNSAVNKTVTNDHQLTADDQSNAKSDVDLAAKVRRALVKDKSLSTYAHNVKVIVKNGVVTMKGPVQSDAERQTVTKIAADVAGADKVQADGIVTKK